MLCIPLPRPPRGAPRRGGGRPLPGGRGGFCDSCTSSARSSNFWKRERKTSLNVANFAKCSLTNHCFCNFEECTVYTLCGAKTSHRSENHLSAFHFVLINITTSWRIWDRFHIPQRAEEVANVESTNKKIPKCHLWMFLSCSLNCLCKAKGEKRKRRARNHHLKTPALLPCRQTSLLLELMAHHQTQQNRNLIEKNTKSGSVIEKGYVYTTHCTTLAKEKKKNGHLDDA